MCDKAVSEESFLILYCPDEYKTQRMCDEAVDNSLKTLKLIPDWFVTSKMIKNFLVLCTQMKIYCTLMKILVMLYFLVMKWVFLIQILIIIIMMIILMKIILIPLFISNFWLGILSLKNVKCLKKDKGRINAYSCSLTSQKMVEFLHVRR